MAGEPDVQLALIAEAAAPLQVSRETFCAFELPGPPRAWERARAHIVQGRIIFYVSTEEQLYRSALAWAAKTALRGKSATQLPVALMIHAFMPIPASWTMRERLDARAGREIPALSPDADNLAKVVGDALKEIVWMDDAQIVDLRVIKRYSATPALRIEVREFVSSA